MSRNRIIYQSEGVYVSKNQLSTSQADHKQLKRIQGIDYSFEVPRQYINQYGQLGAIDSIVIASPTVAVNLSYYLTDLENESNLGFYVKRNIAVYTGSNGLEVSKENGSFSGYISNNEANFISQNLIQESGFNFYIATAREGLDLNLESTISGKPIIGIGNALVTNYSLEASVGNFPTVNIQAQGLNINSSIYKDYQITETSSDVGFPIASVNVVSGKTLSLNDNGYYNLIKLPNPVPSTGDLEITALRPSDIILSFNSFQEYTITNLNAGYENINLQSFSLQVDFNRQENQELGYKFVNSRPVGFPVIATLNINAILNETQVYNLMKNIDDSSGKSISISINSSKNKNKKAVHFDLRNFLITTESFASNVGQNKSVDLIFEAQFGSALDLKNGIFASGSFFEDFVPTNNLFFNVINGDNDWFNQNLWFRENSFSINLGSLPQSYSNVIMYGDKGAYVDLDNPAWIQPNLIDTRNVSDPLGICFYSASSSTFNGTVLGNSSFWGSASPI
jgi:hypothetical protein